MRDVFQLPLIRLHLRDVGEQRDVVLRLAVRIAHGRDVGQRGIELAVAGPVPELAVPVAAVHQRLPHGVVELGALHAGFKEARILADRLLVGVAGNPGKGVVDFNDGAGGVGNDDAFARVRKHLGRALQTHFVPPSLGHIRKGHENAPVGQAFGDEFDFAILPIGAPETEKTLLPGPIGLLGLIVVFARLRLPAAQCILAALAVRARQLKPRPHIRNLVQCIAEHPRECGVDQHEPRAVRDQCDPHRRAFHQHAEVRFAFTQTGFAFEHRFGHAMHVLRQVFDFLDAGMRNLRFVVPVSHRFHVRRELPHPPHRPATDDEPGDHRHEQREGTGDAERHQGRADDGKGFFGRLRDQRRPARLRNRRRTAEIVDRVEPEIRRHRRIRASAQWRQVLEVFLAQGAYRIGMADDIAAPVDDDRQHVVRTAQQAGEARHFFQIEFADQDAVHDRRRRATAGKSHRPGQGHDDVSTRRQVGVRPDRALPLTRGTDKAASRKIDAELVVAQRTPFLRQANPDHALLVVDDIDRFDALFGVRDGIEH